MGVTSSSSEIIHLTSPESLGEPDHERPVKDEELVAALRRRTRLLEEHERVDADVSGNDAFGV